MRGFMPVVYQFHLRRSAISSVTCRDASGFSRNAVIAGTMHALSEIGWRAAATQGKMVVEAEPNDQQVLRDRQRRQADDVFDLSELSVASRHRATSTHAPANNPCFNLAARIHAQPSAVAPSAQEGNDIRADVVLAKELKSLIRRRYAFMSESSNALLSCCHRDLVYPSISVGRRSVRS
jgi:hypothetical protein